MAGDLLLLRAITIVVAVGAIAASPSASADVYRCVGPDGQIVFTDNRATCPKSDKHEPIGKLQTIATEEAPALPTEEGPEPAALIPTRLESSARQLEDERAQKQHWQQKKRMKEEELRALQERHARLSEYVTACNRGMEIVSKDETGMKFRVSCDQIRKEYAESEALQALIREYLETGLEQECRQAGCLPGWIR